ncbi:MAG: hypothetical protein II826_01350 [Prevotella sp.]|nr:hypothetical protein [Prevotella sp.]
MRTKKLFLILALLCAMVQTSWAQASWEEACAMTNTSAANWTLLDGDSQTGKTLGTSGTTTYYHVTGNLEFSNSTEGGSGLTILGMVYFYVPEGVTVTCKGADARFNTGAGAGIELAEGNSLCFLGKGAVNATGGNAFRGGYGYDGGTAYWKDDGYSSGSGGEGGFGGGGAGAGVGTRGGDGGEGGKGALGTLSAWSNAGGNSGYNGEAGATAGRMGNLYVAQSSFHLTAKGGAVGTIGTPGPAGKSCLYDSGYNYGAAGGGGGGAGGFGGAASNIGTGGPGGGGGGGGASGNLEWAGSGYYVVRAPGGKGGQNPDRTWAGAGGESILNYANLNNGQAYSNSSGWNNNDSYISTQPVGTGGSGGEAGNASISGSVVNLKMNMPSQEEWDMVCLQTQTNKSQWMALPLGAINGATIGIAGTETYYFATGDCTFTNSYAGGSGLTIKGTVHLYVAEGATVTCTGGNAEGAMGAGAGVELTAENALCLLGNGSLTATGGNAADGSNGSDGRDAGYDKNNYWSGTGGIGGSGGGGAGAGIGTRGGSGACGGDGAASVVSPYKTANGGNGVSGETGQTAGPMGGLYVVQSTFHLSATGGMAGMGGIGGSAGKSILDDDTTFNYGAAGGGGGGAGGYGGAATGIGNGGPGGGGGGGGASGNLDWAESGYYVVRAPGGKGGQTGSGTWAVDGAESILNYENLNNGQAVSNSSGWGNYDSYESPRVVGTSGSGGAAGNASTSESPITVTTKMPTQSEWDKICLQTKTTQSQWRELPFGGRMGTTIGTAGTTTYYYATGDRTYTGISGYSGLVIQGTVYLFIASGQTITCTGGDASGTTCGGAGIELTEGNTLRIVGSGTMNATGGNAANGGNGKNGEDAYQIYRIVTTKVYVKFCQPGSGGNGGDGGGGAGAGIGTSGGNGGSGGTGGAAKRDREHGFIYGMAGNDGSDGSTAQGPIGTLYVASDITLNVKGGNAGITGSGGNRGKNGGHHSDRFDSDNGKGYFASGGGGGAGGGKGGAASNVGTGGPGGGGGGGGAAGNATYDENGSYYYWRVGAGGGTGGQNGDEATSASDGTTSELANPHDAEFNHRLNEYEWTDKGWHEEYGMLAGGTGGRAGAASRSAVYGCGSYYDEEAYVNVSLADNADNGRTIGDNDNSTVVVTLQDRNFFHDGAWNTLCLPFNVDNFTGTPLEGATVKTLASTDFSGGTLTMNFTDDVTSIEAGKPYIVKWAAGTDIESPVFTGVTISNVTVNVKTGFVDFVGTYSPVSIYTEEKTNLYIGDGNTLYYPTEPNFQVNAFRGYFQLKQGLKASDSADPNAGVRTFVLNFGGDDNETGILTTNFTNPTNSDNAWYTLDGRKLNGRSAEGRLQGKKPTRAGVYINNGKKVVIK